ncbi:MAG: hypothetical protein H6Q57_716 [Geobacteraceae bacterium]|jgi:hypothetical protein|nr:hypothetical protein [Geobacteraceae bacterium]
MRITSFLVVLGLLAAAVFCCAQAHADTEKTAGSAARSWLTLVDKDRYAESWKEASAYFRGAVSMNTWVTSLDGVRKPLGRVLSRKLRTTRQYKELPGAPDGRYVVMEYRTSFENKRSATETVTFVLEKDGTWKAAGYFIK